MNSRKKGSEPSTADVRSELNGAMKKGGDLLSDDTRSVQNPKEEEPLTYREKAEKLAQGLTSWLTWRLMLLCGIEIKYEEVRDRRYPSGVLQIPPEGQSVTDTAVKHAEEVFGASKTRLARVNAKSKTLLSLIALLISLVLGAIAILSGEGVLWHVAASLAALLLFGSLFLILTNLGVGSHALPTNDLLFEEDENKQKYLRVTGLLQAAHINDGATSFLVDVYRAAYRLFLTALLVALILSIARIQLSETGVKEATKESARVQSSDKYAPNGVEKALGGAQQALDGEEDTSAGQSDTSADQPDTSNGQPDTSRRENLLQELPNELRQSVESLGSRAPLADVQVVIGDLCAWRAFRPGELATLLDRSRKHVLSAYIKPLVDAGELERTHPETPHHPDQAYVATPEDTE